MQKISTAALADVLGQVPFLLRKQASRITELEGMVAKYRKRERCEKIATAIEDKGLSTELTHDEQVESLMNMTEDDLGVTERAVDLSGPGEVKLASLSDANTPNTPAVSELEQFLLGGDDLSL